MRSFQELVTTVDNETTCRGEQYRRPGVIFKFKSVGVPDGGRSHLISPSHFLHAEAVNFLGDAMPGTGPSCRKAAVLCIPGRANQRFFLKTMYITTWILTMVCIVWHNVAPPKYRASSLWKKFAIANDDGEWLSIAHCCFNTAWHTNRGRDCGVGMRLVTNGAVLNE